MISAIHPATDSPAAPPADPARAAAQKLQAAFFTDLLKHGGMAEAFSTGSDTLDAMTSVVLEQVAEDMARQDPSLAEHFYTQLSRNMGDTDRP